MIIWDANSNSEAPTSAQTIVLYRGPNGWIADFAQTREASTLRRLYGRYGALQEVPDTTIDTPAVDVYNLIKLANPEYLVYVR